MNGSDFKRNEGGKAKNQESQNHSITESQNEVTSYEVASNRIENRNRKS